VFDPVTSQRVWNALDRRVGTLELVVGARDETRRSAAGERAVHAQTAQHITVTVVMRLNTPVI